MSGQNARLDHHAAEARARQAAPAPENTREDTRSHHDEVMASHEGAPSIEVQDRTHGAGLPAVDNGTAS